MMSGLGDKFLKDLAWSVRGACEDLADDRSRTGQGDVDFAELPGSDQTALPRRQDQHIPNSCGPGVLGAGLAVAKP